MDQPSRKLWRGCEWTQMFSLFSCSLAGFFVAFACGYLFNSFRTNLRLLAWRVLGDLRSLQAQSTHQTFLIEEEYIDALLQRGGAKRFCDDGIHHTQARGRSTLPAAALVQII